MNYTLKGSDEIGYELLMRYYIERLFLMSNLPFNYDYMNSMEIDYRLMLIILFEKFIRDLMKTLFDDGNFIGTN